MWRVPRVSASVWSSKSVSAQMKDSFGLLAAAASISVLAAILTYLLFAAHKTLCVCVSRWRKESVSLSCRSEDEQAHVKPEILLVFLLIRSITWGVNKRLSVIFVWTCELLWGVSGGTLRLIKEADGWTFTSSSSAFPLINVRHLEPRRFSEASGAARWSF